MSARTRDVLKPEFKDGERPSGDDFADLIDSFVNKLSDGVSVDTDQNLLLSRGLRLSDSAMNLAGGLRFSGGQVQFHNGTTWTSFSTGGSGSFLPVGTGGAVQFSGANVGVNTGAVTAPVYRLDVTLGAPTVPAEQVRLGNLVCTNGTGVNATAAVIGHQARTTSANVNTDFALRQTQNGPVHVNAPTGQVVSFRQGGSSIRMGISASGNVVVGGEGDLVTATAPTTVPPVGGSVPVPILQVAGEAFKNTGTSAWMILSDARLKDDVRDLDAGLAHLQRVRPVRFQYNGRAGTVAGMPGVGILGQEVEAVLPETIRRVAFGNAMGGGFDDLRVFDASALTFVLINAVKELATRVEHLEQALAVARDDGNARQTN